MVVRVPYVRVGRVSVAVLAVMPTGSAHTVAAFAGVAWVTCSVLSVRAAARLVKMRRVR